MALSTSSSFFCEHCGAANDVKAKFCCFCGLPLEEEEPKPSSSVSPTLTHTLPLDTLLKGRYRIIKPIGQGGMGTVYRAQDTSLNDRPVALKELIVNDPETQDTQKAIEAFTREATLLANLQHANLPSVFEHFQENGHWYMAMSYIQGETLEEYLEHSKRKKLQFHEVLEIGKQLSSVLYYLHSQHPPIIFRDVKPANIMRTPDGRIYLIDFGVARRFKSGQKKDTVPFGSLGYAAPEQFGKAQTTARSDIYGLGATLYELLTGHEPASSPLKFPALRSMEPTLPFKLTSLITEMLDHDENKRPTSMLLVEQRLQEIESAPWQSTSVPYTTLSTPNLATANNKPSRHTIGGLGTFLVLLSLIIGGAIGGLIGNSNGFDHATANYQNNVDATASAQAEATATEAQIVALPDPYLPQGTLALFDPLSQANQWQEYPKNSTGGSCAFKMGAFQVTETQRRYFYHCDQENGTVFQNFTVEVKMTIVQGDCGGLVLRQDSDGSGKLYLVDVCGDGSYAFLRYQSDSGNTAVTVTSDQTKAIHPAPTENIVAVVANRGHFDLYVNNTKIVSVTDNTYNEGTIGLVADCTSASTTVAYRDIKIWALS